MLSIEDVKEKVNNISRSFKIKKLGVFGSLVRGELTSKSDIDFIVEFNDDGYNGRCDRYMDLIEELEKIFGRKIDLITYESLNNPVFKATVEKEMKIIYE